MDRPGQLHTTADMSGPKLVFVSYASLDHSAGERIVNEIEEAGILCWMAPRDVPIGANYGLAIVQAIEATKVTMVLLSSHANESVHVANEIERAVNYRKPIIPVRIEEVKPARDIELHVSARQWVDLFQSPKQREINMNLLISALRDMLRDWLVPELQPLKADQKHPPQVDAAPVSALSPSSVDPGLGSDGSISGPTAERNSETFTPPAPDLVKLPDSSPTVRQAVELAIKETKTDGQNVAFVASRLFSKQGPRATAEICLLLSEGKQDYWPTVNAIKLLRFSLSQPGARQFDRLVLKTLSAALATTGEIRGAAIDLIKSWPVPPMEKWACLMDWLWAASNSGGWVLVSALVDTTPGDRRAETGAAIANLMLAGDEQLIKVCILGIQKLNYQAAAQNLRELVETTLSPGVAAAAAGVLAGWGDRDAAAAIRIAMGHLRLDHGSFAELARALRNLEGEACASFVADRLMEASVDVQKVLLQYSWLDEFCCDPLISKVRTIEATTANLQLKEAARTFLSKIHSESGGPQARK